MYFVESATIVARKFYQDRLESNQRQRIKSPVLYQLSYSPDKIFLQNTLCSSEQITGQSRVTLVTHDKGCVRYPTEGNSSNHELTTAMHHLSTCLAMAIVSLGFHVSFKSW